MLYIKKYPVILFLLVFLLSLAVQPLDVYASPLAAPTHINLGASEKYAVLAGSGITNTGATTITGDVGSSPTSTETGFGTVTIVDGANHTDPDPNDADTVAAKTALSAAYTNAAGQGPRIDIPGLTLGAGQTLMPGVYNSDTTIQVNGTLTLDGGGDPNAVFVFQAGSSLTTSSASRILLTNGTQACNVYWQVGSSATLGTTTTFKGIIMALTSITMDHAATLDGQALARNGAVTLDNNTITLQLCAPEVSKSFSPASIDSGTGTSTLTVTFSNINVGDIQFTNAFTDNLPSGLEIASTPNASTTCAPDVGSSLTAAAGGSSVSMSSGYFIPGEGDCTLSVDVTAPDVGSYLNTIPIGTLETSGGDNLNSTSATLLSINDELLSPTITTSLSATDIIVGNRVRDTAVLTGATATAGGTVIYTIYSDSTCTLNAKTAGTVTVTNAVVPNSNLNTFTLAGTYYWQALYSGDAANNGAISTCTSEELTVNKATPALSVKGSGPVGVGDNIKATARLTGGYGLLIGNLTFDVYAPSDTTFSSPIRVGAAKIVHGTGSYISANFATTEVGYYHWVAHYSGDSNNNALNTATTDIGSTSRVNLFAPAGSGSGLPGTGFAPGIATRLSKQPSDKAYAELGDLWVEIPTLNIQAAILGIPASKDGWDLTWLGNNVGWLDGTAFPTWAGNSVLTAHVYDVNGEPGLFVNLDQLRWGDQVIVHAWGQSYIYEVRSIKDDVRPDDINAISHEEFPWLTLITCKDYDSENNSYLYRVVVRAVQDSSRVEVYFFLNSIAGILIY